MGRISTHRQVQLDCIHRLVERPSELMFPECLHHHVLHVLQLVSLSARLAGVGDFGWGRVHRARGCRDPRGGSRCSSGHPLAACSLAVTVAAQRGAPRGGLASHFWAQSGTCRNKQRSYHSEGLHFGKDTTFPTTWMCGRGSPQSHPGRCSSTWEKYKCESLAPRQGVWKVQRA